MDYLLSTTTTNGGCDPSKLKWNRLCRDEEADTPMFRVVIKSHFTYNMCHDFIRAMENVILSSCQTC